jgi:hypothetical protein
MFSLISANPKDSIHFPYILANMKIVYISLYPIKDEDDVCSPPISAHPEDSIHFPYILSKMKIVYVLPLSQQPLKIVYIFPIS